MYTATTISRSIQRASRNFVATVEFDNGTEKFQEDFTFPLNVTKDEYERKINEYITRLDSLQKNVDTVAPLGLIDLSNAGEYVPTASDIAREAWLSDWSKLVSAQRLIDHGVTLTTQQQTAVTTIRNRIATNLKVEYLGLI